MVFIVFHTQVMNMIVAVLVHVVSSVATLQQINQQNGDLATGSSRGLAVDMAGFQLQKWWILATKMDSSASKSWILAQMVDFSYEMMDGTKKKRRISM